MSGQASGAVGATKLTRFTIFNRLPPEIRLMIWEEHIRFPRIIPICDRWEGLYSGPHFGIDDITRKGVPTSLLVNRESRHVAMKSLVLFDIQFFTDRHGSWFPYYHYAISRYDIAFFPQYKRWDGMISRMEGDIDKIVNIMIRASTSSERYVIPEVSTCMGRSFDWSPLTVISWAGFNCNSLESLYYLMVPVECDIDHCIWELLMDEVVFDDLSEIPPEHPLPPTEEEALGDLVKKLVRFVTKPHWQKSLLRTRVGI
ncbi:hypothetical protein F5B18DRAFT_204802 [Nemania serpens]|nr:hypothetical protein F5B18DRAFT_204802 [Nemania serpens]